MTRPDYSYVSYLAATPERVWEALTDAELTRKVYGERMESDWAEGSTFRALTPDGCVTSEGRVLAADRPKVLAYVWERALVAGDELSPMPRAVATLTIEALGAGDVVRLTVTEHHDPPVDESYLEGARRGWPLTVSRLKTLLETGRELPPIRRAPAAM